MDLNSALEKLFSLHQFGIKLGLECITNLLEHLGNPHKHLKTFHIAGTNGKGSTASFMASILIEAGYKVGLYTSPHFVKYNERIRVNGEMIGDDYVREYVNSLNDYIDKYQPTFFEITTALAFKYFAEQNVDYAIIETGLGGRLDATNVINPIASVITSISLEHTEHLGNTIEQIALEKAGIIKPNTNVFLGTVPREAEEAIKKKTVELGCKLFQLNEFVESKSERVIVNLDKGIFSIYFTPLRGNYQLYNCALAIKTLNTCLNIRDGMIFRQGIANVLGNTGIEGRYEIINEFPRIIFDSAHNPESLATFLEEFARERSCYTERVLLFAAMKDKAIPEMLKLAKPHFDKIYVTKVNIDRSSKVEQLMVIAAQVGIKAKRVSNPIKFVTKFYKEGPAKCLVVLGSMYLIGEIKAAKVKKELDNIK
jgi:dihydrofolate synthase/folylpolyglutamate synthase